MRFKPTENFDYILTDEAGVKRHIASYVAGHEYHCRTPEMEKKAAAWAEEGKVILIDAVALPPLNQPAEEK